MNICARQFTLAMSVAVAFSVFTSAASDANLAEGAHIKASSAMASYPATAAADGVVTDKSRWLAADGDPLPWIEVTFPKPVKIGALDIFSGYKKDGALEAFDLSFEVDGKWVSPAEGKVRDSHDTTRRIEVELRNVAKLRLTLVKPGPARIREIAVYESKDALVSAGLKGDVLPAAAIDRTRHQIAVNQVGYEIQKPKRFTAPLSPDGTPFFVRAVGDATVLHQGEIHGGVGDFSAFSPADSTTHYVIEVRGGTLKKATSDPFLIRANLYQEQFWQPAVDFLMDARSVVGTHPSAYGGCPWRDGTYYDAIIPALVLFYLADPKTIEAMPRQIDWAAEKARVLNPEFKFDAKNPCSQGVMDAVRNYYQLEPPKPDAPDVVKLIHWGAGYYLVNPATRDPSGDPDKLRIHAQTVEQVAYVVWAWPVLKQWLPESFYVKCRDFCFANWQQSLEISKWWDSKTYISFDDKSGKNPMGGLLHPFKGRHAPGHSIVPNLLMHEVAKREGRDDAGIYLAAAVAQADWCVKNLDWNEPRTTKGQRMSEHRTIPNLVWLLQKYPAQSPPGLREKIAAWVDVALARSENFWDYRRYDLQADWTIPELNDVGSSLGLPACLLSASWVVDESRRKRIEEVAFASVDHVWGRNPRLAAAPSQPQMGFPEVERGWPKSHPHNVCARLELCRGSISSLPGSEMYPFNPEGDYRHAEGWVNYGAAWCISLAYLKFDAAKTTPPMTSTTSVRSKFKSKIHIPVQLAKEITSLPPAGYQLVFSDEFNGTSLDTNRWSFRLGDKLLSAQEPGNVSVKNGNLEIALRKESVRGKAYTGGGVISRQKFVYGYYEARFKTPPAEGWHTAFWSMRHRFGDTNSPLPLLELDFCEQDGGDPHFFSFGVINQSRYHQIKNHQSWNAGRWVIEDAPDTSADFHVWGCEFTPETTRFYFDGKLTKELSSSGFPHDEMNVWISAIASTLKGDRFVDDSKLPNAVLCDYVSVYQHPKYRDAEAAVRAEVLRPLPPLEKKKSTEKAKEGAPKLEDLN